jgi:hypothetical protein
MRLTALIGRASTIFLVATLCLAVQFQYATCDPPAELLDVPDSVLYAAESQTSPDCGCELNVTQCRHGSRCARCCCGRDVCCPTVEEVTEERSCWKVSCEKVCVPAVRLPWEPGGSKLTLFSWLRPHHAKCHCGQHAEYNGDCDACAQMRAASCMPKCGPVRCVAVLESESYEVKVCRCKWDIRTLPGCCNSECCAQGGEEAASTETQPIEEGDLPAPQP